MIKVNNRIRITFKVRNNLTGNLDSTGLIVTVTDPSNAVTNPPVENFETGVYYVDIKPTVKGVWKYRAFSDDVDISDKFMVQ